MTGKKLSIYCIEKLAGEKGGGKKYHRFKDRFNEIIDSLDKLEHASSSSEIMSLEKAICSIENNSYLKKKCLNQEKEANLEIRHLRDKAVKKLETFKKRETRCLINLYRKRIYGQSSFIKNAAVSAAAVFFLLAFPGKTTKNDIDYCKYPVIENVQSTRKLVLDINRFTLEVYEKGEKTKEFPAAIGKPATPTPLGDFEILGKESWGRYYAGSFLRFKRCIDDRGKEWGGWGIHGFYTDWSIGYALSKGCVRLKKEDGLYLKEIIPIGTELQVKYDTIRLDKEKKIVTIFSDIYDRKTNTIENVIKELRDAGVPEYDADKEKIAALLEKAAVNTEIYKNVSDNLHNRFVKPLKDGVLYPHLVKKNPGIEDYLKTMSENEKVNVPLNSILKDYLIVDNELLKP